jgi:hypothetical protein
MPLASGRPDVANTVRGTRAPRHRPASLRHRSPCPAPAAIASDCSRPAAQRPARKGSTPRDGGPNPAPDRLRKRRRSAPARRRIPSGPVIRHRPGLLSPSPVAGERRPANERVALPPRVPTTQHAAQAPRQGDRRGRCADGRRRATITVAAGDRPARTACRFRHSAGDGDRKAAALPIPLALAPAPNRLPRYRADRTAMTGRFRVPWAGWQEPCNRATV